MRKLVIQKNVYHPARFIPRIPQYDREVLFDFNPVSNFAAKGKLFFSPSGREKVLTKRLIAEVRWEAACLTFFFLKKSFLSTLPKSSGGNDCRFLFEGAGLFFFPYFNPLFRLFALNMAVLPLFLFAYIDWGVYDYHAGFWESYMKRNWDRREKKNMAVVSMWPSIVAI